jgi:anti-sigma factor RsiW
MKEMMNSPGCERAEDLVAFLYHEMDERETREFRVHLQQCSLCRQELASLAVVRESITVWREEALAGFVSTPVTTKSRKSAVSALRQFFDLSPLWLKGATAFAMIAFVVLAALAFVKLRTNNVPTGVNADAKYTEQDVNQIVKEALAKQADASRSVETQTETAQASETPKPKKSKVSPPSQLAKSRRPLSRSEREQLAADLRLLSTDEDTTLHLLGDRINQ